MKLVLIVCYPEAVEKYYFYEMIFPASILQEEDLYEIDVPLRFFSAVSTRIHGLACWFDVLFNGR